MSANQDQQSSTKKREVGQVSSASTPSQSGSESTTSPKESSSGSQSQDGSPGSSTSSTSPVEQWDSDGNGKIGLDEVSAAGDAFARGEISREKLTEVSNQYTASSASSQSGSESTASPKESSSGSQSRSGGSSRFDVNGDGVVDTSDATDLSFRDQGPDLNGNGEFSVADAQWLFAHQDELTAGSAAGTGNASSSAGSESSSAGSDSSTRPTNTGSAGSSSPSSMSGQGSGSSSSDELMSPSELEERQQSWDLSKIYSEREISRMDGGERWDLRQALAGGNLVRPNTARGIFLRGGGYEDLSPDEQFGFRSMDMELEQWAYGSQEAALEQSEEFARDLRKYPEKADLIEDRYTEEDTAKDPSPAAARAMTENQTSAAEKDPDVVSGSERGSLTLAGRSAPDSADPGSMSDPLIEARQQISSEGVAVPNAAAGFEQNPENFTLDYNAGGVDVYLSEEGRERLSSSQTEAAGQTQETGQQDALVGATVDSGGAAARSREEVSASERGSLTLAGRSAPDSADAGEMSEPLINARQNISSKGVAVPNAPSSFEQNPENFTLDYNAGSVDVYLSDQGRRRLSPDDGGSSNQPGTAQSTATDRQESTSQPRQQPQATSPADRVQAWADKQGLGDYSATREFEGGWQISYQETGTEKTTNLAFTQQAEEQFEQQQREQMIEAGEEQLESGIAAADEPITQTAPGLEVTQTQTRTPQKSPEKDDTDWSFGMGDPNKDEVEQAVSDSTQNWRTELNQAADTISSSNLAAPGGVTAALATGGGGATGALVANDSGPARGFQGAANSAAQLLNVPGYLSSGMEAAERINYVAGPAVSSIGEAQAGQFGEAASSRSTAGERAEQTVAAGVEMAHEGAEWAQNNPQRAYGAGIVGAGALALGSAAETAAVSRVPALQKIPDGGSTARKSLRAGRTATRKLRAKVDNSRVRQVLKRNEEKRLMTDGGQQIARLDGQTADQVSTETTSDDPATIEQTDQLARDIQQRREEMERELQKQRVEQRAYEHATIEGTDLNSDAQRRRAVAGSQETTPPRADQNAAARGANQRRSRAEQREATVQEKRIRGDADSVRRRAESLEARFGGTTAALSAGQEQRQRAATATEARVDTRPLDRLRGDVGSRSIERLDTRPLDRLRGDVGSRSIERLDIDQRTRTDTDQRTRADTDQRTRLDLDQRTRLDTEQRTRLDLRMDVDTRLNLDDEPPELSPETQMDGFGGGFASDQETWQVDFLSAGASVFGAPSEPDMPDGGNL